MFVVTKLFMRRSLCFLLILSFTGITIASQAQITISGKVTDRKKPVAGVSITLKDTYDGATSDSLGNFSFKTTEKGDHVLVFTAINYKPVEQPIKIQQTNITSLDIILKEEITE